jgi:hypothetical protein
MRAKDIYGLLIKSVFKMKLKKEENGWILTLDKKGNSFVCPINDWGQIFGHWNWYSFHLIHIYAENDIVCPGWEFEFAILGLGFRIRINRSWVGIILQKRLDEIKSGKVKLKELK